MAHFAKIENETVLEVIVVSNDVLEYNGDFPNSEKSGQKFLESCGIEGAWLQTSYNNNFRGNYAQVGFSYDKDLDAFLPPKPYPSWSLDQSTYQWVPPIPYLEGEDSYSWNESSQSWYLDN
jgi:hypothetical protein